MTWATDGIIRLKRTEWAPNIQPFVDELALILSQVPEDATGPTQVSPTDDGTGTISIPSLGGLNFPAFDLPSLLAGLDPFNPLQEEQGETPDNNGSTTTTKKNSWVRYSAPALVTASSGGGLYTAIIYPNGPLNLSAQLSINLNALNDDASIATSTYVMAHAILKVQVTTQTKRTASGAIVSTSTSLKLLSEQYYCQASGGTGGGGIPCKIVSGGPGDTYTASLYENGTSQPATGSVTVKQMQIDSAETIPPDTWCFASQIGGTYYVQVPVWV